MFVYFIDSSPGVTVTIKNISFHQCSIIIHPISHYRHCPTQAVGTFWKVGACQILHKAE